MAKILRIASLLGSGILLLFFVILFGLVHLIEVGEFRRFILHEIESRTRLRAELGEAELRVGRMIGLSIQNFALHETDDSAPVILAERVLVRVALLPLLERRLVFDEVRLERPEIRMGGGLAGQSPLVDLLTARPIQRSEEARLALDIERVRVESGRVVFQGRRAGLNGITLRGMDLSLRRIRAVDASGPTPQPMSDIPGLEYRMTTTIERDGGAARVASQGKVWFPDGGSRHLRAWVDSEIAVEAVAASQLGRFFSVHVPIKGTLSSRLRWRGRLAERAEITGEVDFQQLEVDAPAYYPHGLRPADGGVELEIDLSPEEIRLRRLDLRSGEIRLSLQGSVRAPAEKDPYLEVRLTTPFLPLSAAWEHLPLGSPAWTAPAKAVSRGEMRVNGARVAGRLSEIRRLPETGLEDHLWFDAEVRGVGGELPGGRYRPVSGVGGRVVLEKGVLHYRGFEGAYGLSVFKKVEGSHRGILAGHDLLVLRGEGRVDLGDLSGHLKADLLPARVAEAAERLRELSGTGELRFLLRTDFAASHHYEGEISLSGVALRVDDLSLSQVRGDLTFSPDQIRLQGITALAGGSPLNIRGALRDSRSDGSVFDLTFESPGVEAGLIKRLFFSSDSPDEPGTVRGSLRYRGSLAPGRDRTLTGSLEVAGLRLPLAPLQKSLREVSGNLTLDGTGIDLRAMRAWIGDHELRLDGRWTYEGQPQLTFSLKSPEMDLGELIPKEATQVDDWYDRLHAKGLIQVDKGRYQGLTFSDLKAGLTLRSRRWTFDELSARSLGGRIQGAGSLKDDPEVPGFSFEPDIRGVPLKGLLGLFGGGTDQVSGRVDFKGFLESSGGTALERKKNLNGAFRLRIEDGVVRRLRLLVRILGLLDLSHWFSLKMPDINQEGIRFRTIDGTFKVTRGVYSTENLVLDSDHLRLTGAGQWDGPNDDLSFVVAIRPFPKMDSAVNSIPLIGQGLAGIKNSLLVASFNIKGPIEEPSITPAPLSTLSEFFYGALAIPREIIGLQGEKRN